MKIALASKHFINGDIKQNLSTIEDSLKEVFSHRVDFLCFGEAFLQGFDSLSFNYENDQFIALTLDSQEINQLKQLAKTYQIGLGIGYLQLEKNKIYCSYLILDKNGDIIQNFKRVSTGWKYPDTDPIHYQEGTEFQTFTYLDKTFTIGLCGDFWDEKNVSSVAALKTDIILWPLYVNFSIHDFNTIWKPQYVEQAKKLGEQVLFINSLSTNPNVFGGCLYIKNGTIVFELPFGEEGILILTM